MNTRILKECYICSFNLKKSRSISSEVSIVPAGLDRSNSENFELYPCSNCGTVNLYDQKRGKNSKGLYDESLCLDASKLTEDLSKVMNPYSTDLIDSSIASSWSNFLAIDMGCGGGYFTKRLAKYCKEVHAADIDRTAIKNLQENEPDITSYVMDFNQIPKNKYDIISLIGVFEHLPNPQSTIQLIKEGLRKKDDSLIIIAYPNLASMSRKISRLSKHDWDMFLEPGHLHIPSKKGFKDLLTKNNLVIKKYYTSSNIIRGKLPLPYRNANLEHKVLKIISTNKLARFVYQAYFKILDFFNLGDISIYIIKNE